MKIYDKTLQEILRDIPLPFKIMMVAGLLFIAMTIIYVPYVIVTFGDKEDFVPPLQVDGLKKENIGILDPTISFDGEKHFMTYTAVSKPASGSQAIRTEVFIAREKRFLQCTRWIQTTLPFPTKGETIIGPDGSTPVASGFWRIETPSLVYDPDDKGKEWKLYAYKYFWAGKTDLARLYGAIVHRYTSDPADPDGWSTEEWVLGSGAQSPPYPYSQIVQTNMADLHPSLTDVYFYARPSVVYIDKTLVMSLSAFVMGKQTPDRVVVIASKDHGRTWHYLGTPLRDTMVPQIKTDTGSYSLLQGATLVLHQGVPYLAAVLGNARIEGAGTFIFGFDNISAGSLIKDDKGHPLLLNHIRLSSQLPTNVGGGFAAYHDSCTGSGVISAEMSGILRQYSIFRTEKPLLEKP